MLLEDEVEEGTITTFKKTLRQVQQWERLGGMRAMRRQMGLAYLSDLVMTAKVPDSIL